MKLQDRYQKAFNYFKQSYNCRMGGTQIIVLPNGKSKEFDDRLYYSGKGQKYNSNINHHIIGIKKVTRKEYKTFLDYCREQQQLNQIRIENATQLNQRIETAKQKGIYSLKKTENGFFVELSEEESNNKTYSPERLAKTLAINVNDAKLLKSTGKTYVFAESKTGKVYELYHSSLSCNNLNIWVSEATPQRIAEFDHEKWFSAPYAAILGQTINKNHFVC